MCWSFFVNKTAGWSHNINIQSLIHLHFLYCAAYNKIQAFCIIHIVCSYTTANVISNVEIWGNGKSNEAKIFFQSRWQRWQFFFDLELGQSFFHVKNSPSQNITNLSYNVKIYLSDFSFHTWRHPWPLSRSVVLL